MKKSLLPLFTAAGAALLAFATPALAGMFTVTSGPIFTPDAAFTNNTIKVETFHSPSGVNGDLVKLSGNATITQPPSNSAMVEVAGNYSANAGDQLSAAYSFTIDSNFSRPVNYTVSGSATVLGSPQTFNKTDTVVMGLHQYKGTIQLPISFPFPASGTFSASFTLNFSSASASETTADSAALGTLNLAIQQADFQLASTAATLPASARALNIATRLNVLTDNNVLIGGFIITGNTSKKVMLRAIGPSLTGFGVAGALLDPTLELHKPDGSIVTNDNWKIDDSTGQSQEATIRATMLQPSNDLESAILQTLDPGAYTAIVRGKNSGIGIGVVEAYDLDQAAPSQLANISTRGFVNTGDNVMIGGFILGPNNNGASSIVVRAIGPSLASSGVTNPLQDPTLELRSGDGTLIASNDNWMDGSDKQTIQDNGLAPKNDKESALLAIPPPGNYTAIVRGANNTTGVGVVEAYNLQ